MLTSALDPVALSEYGLGLEGMNSIIPKSTNYQSIFFSSCLVRKHMHNARSSSRAGSLFARSLFDLSTTIQKLLRTMVRSNTFEWVEVCCDN